MGMELLRFLLKKIPSVPLPVDINTMTSKILFSDLNDSGIVINPINEALRNNKIEEVKNSESYK